MATGWMKSLQCKSRAFDDVVSAAAGGGGGRRHGRRALSNSGSCKNSDIVESTKPKKQKTPNTAPFRRTESGPAVWTGSGPFSPALAELPRGHPSRNVVEIIFHTSWGEKSFSGDVEMVFKVQNLNRTVARFEEYREMVKSRATAAADASGGGGGEDQARCVADGNEVMRFYCLGATASGGAYEAGCSAWAVYGGKGAVLCTYSGSGSAHEKAGGGSGRRAMLVCRVIAGRVCKQLGFNSVLDRRVGSCDSVSKDNGELLVFDTRALLPCFLIIYNNNSNKL
ncbi:uncharacterized protein LOC127243481 [Andrographis paniculata]|uniref:uncharacterized protein LOC127243481 n=1 Tax=Andrographis paniculata TaxID=175694 RepID=UPI0021E9881C|nr:uncharacterized protein LOC127243481 [Andrographis paniculata]